MPSFACRFAFLVFGLLVLSLWVGRTARAADASGDAVWIEGENTSAVEPASFKPTIGQGPGNVLSGGKWLQFSIDAATAPTAIPDSGILLSYAANTTAAGNYEVWAHIGFELIRAPFDWRIDQGPWQNSKPTDLTTDVQELGVWAPVAWLNLGKQNLTAGSHTLQVRVQRFKDKDNKDQAVTFALDAVCLTTKPFHPDGTIKPGDTSWMTDADKAAATQTFEAVAPTSAAQSSISLAGNWQYAPDDELMQSDRLGPVKSIPAGDTLTWHSMTVPGDRNTLLPDQTYVHRYYLRTRVKVDASLADHSFVLHIPGESMIASVFVNGQMCGGTKDLLAVWDVDVTSAIKPGQVNEILVAFKDVFYGLHDDADAKHILYLPYGFWHFNEGHMMDMPAATRFDTGFVLGAPALVVGGKAYTSDVFAKPSVQNKTLALDVTLHNPTGAAITGQLTAEVQPLAGGATEKTFAAKDVSIPAGQDLVVNLSEPWANPKLWWPNDPQQYNVVTTLSVGGKPIDQRMTKFGFREWTWDGPNFKLNGVPYHAFSDTEPKEVDGLIADNQGMLRVWAADVNTEKALDDCDSKGMPVRRTGIFDGEGAAYDVSNAALWDNYRSQLLAWAKGQRNHPSIFIWSMENEITFINGHVTGQDAITTKENKKAADLLMALDPTRPVMTDGGNANLDESLPVYGGHYMEPPFNTFPEGCYDRAGFAHRQVWPVTKEKPVLLGEAAFLNGSDLSDVATVGGEESFLGKGEARPGKTMILRMLSEGYRWNDVNFTFWDNELPSYYNAWKAVAVLSRQWNWSFESGEKVTRTLGIFNNTRVTDPITLNWTLTVGGKKTAEGTSVHNVGAGLNEKFDMVIPMPTVAARQEGVLTLDLTQGGKNVFEDTKAVSILPSASVGLKAPRAGRLAVFDPQGAVKDFLTGLHVPFTPVTDLNQIPPKAKVLIVGKDALEAAASTSSALSGWATLGTGHALIVLEQKYPLKYQALPGQMETDTNHGCLVFEEDAAHPALAGLQNKDFFAWGQDSYAYQNAYVKPTSGGKSILQCDNKLADTALVQMQAGQGTMLLTQMLVGEKLKTNVVAQHLLLNLLAYADSYKLTYLPMSVVADDNPPLMKAIDTIGVKYAKAASPLAALDKAPSIAVINGTAANVKALADGLPKVKAFTQDGGWVVLNNVGPDALADFNKLVGVTHIMRPFAREKVTWPKIRNPLTAGISSGNIVMGTGQQIVDFQAGDYADPDGYSYVVDFDEIAPFSKSPYFAWPNAINNFTQADGAWQLIENMPPEQAVMPITFPQAEKIEQLTWVSDLNYQGTTKIRVTINGKDYDFATEPNGDPQTFDIPDQPTSSQMTVKILDWQHDPAKEAATGGKDLVGIDNIYIKVARPPDFFTKVKPMLNVGTMVEYPNGRGGIMLFNVKYLDTEKNPVNVGKKQALLASILGNLKAQFSGSKTIIAGGNLAFKPIDISKQANQYRTDQGWYGDKAHSFAALPSGKQTIAGVNYDIYHFATSPVPEAIMLGGSGVPGNLADHVAGIPVNQKADALFFLQAARIDAPRNPDEVKTGKKYEIADYIIHYADGKTEKAPVYQEISVDNYMQPAPNSIPGAQIAWSAPYDAAKTSYAVAYSMQWNNPRPDVVISSIDLVYGPDRRAVPAVLAITAAEANGG